MHKATREGTGETAHAALALAQMTCAPNFKNCMSLKSEVSPARSYPTLFFCDSSNPVVGGERERESEREKFIDNQIDD